MLQYRIGIPYLEIRNEESITYAGNTITYGYNRDGELHTIGDYTLTRTNEHRRLKLTDGTYTLIRTYNRYGEVLKYKDDLFNITLIRNKAGQIVQKTAKLQGTKEKVYRYTYDPKGRLIEVKKDNQIVESYTYDANGNRATAKVYGTTTTGSYTLDDNLIVYGDNTYRYDEDGYLVEKTAPQGSTSYTYNTLGALTKVVLLNGTTVEYPQDALNRRVVKKVNEQMIEKYLWEDLTTLLAIYDKDNHLIWRFEYADMRMPVSMTDVNGQRYYLHYDQVGSLRAVSRVLSPDNTFEVVKEIVYDTYGNIISDSNPSFKVPFGFAGGLYDSDTKLVHFGYREYDPYTGKWTAKDPIGFAGGDSNLYGYVLGDPVNKIDPLGLYDCWFDWAPWLGPYKCTQKKDPSESAKEVICKKAEETCSDYAQKAFDYCNETYPSPTKSTVCASIWKDAYDLCQTQINKIPICKEEESCETE